MPSFQLPNLTTIVKSKNESNILGGLLGLANTAYNIFTNKRDFDYQKALQQQIFEREDTAVQRRKADLIAAGFNPALAEGSGAGAGQVVARSNTNDVNMGQMLDYAAALSQIKAQKIQNKILSHEEKIAATKQSQTSMDFETNAWYSDYDRDFMKFLYGYDDDSDHIKHPKLYEYFNNILRDQKNSSDLLQKQNNWYTANQVINAMTSTAGAITGGINSGANMKRANAPWKRYR